MRKILITNDDGIEADGLVRLAAAAQQFGEVVVVAPDGQRSAMSHNITLRHPIEVWKADFPVEGIRAYACNGTPADCARLGILNIVGSRPDCLLSGINFGYNVAMDLQYSATVGAAMEAAFQDILSIAFSEDFSGIHETTDEYLLSIMAELIDKPLCNDRIWNVNFPGCRLSECNGILRNMRTSRQSYFSDHYNATDLGNGHISYMVEGVNTVCVEEGTDFWGVTHNYVTISCVNNVS